MEWLVYWYDSNKGEIVRKNVFALSVSFNESLKTIIRNICELSYSDFKKELLSAVMYSFWCKAEHEIILAPWVSYGHSLKIDVCDQLRLNWDAFASYVWDCVLQKGAVIE